MTQNDNESPLASAQQEPPKPPSPLRAWANWRLLARFGFLALLVALLLTQVDFG